MSPISRREFLGGAVALGGTAALGTWAALALGGDADPSAPSDAPETVASESPGTLVLVTLYGGNDGLNTVIPIADPQYAALRGDLALDPASTHALSEGFALHPALASCKTLWDRQQLAVVHGVGFDGLDRSHFHCMDVWQAGTEDDTASGWVGRWLDNEGDGPLSAVVVGRSLPLLIRGERRAAAVVPASRFTLPGTPALRSRIAAMADVDDERTTLAGQVASTTSDLLEVVDRVGPVVASGATGAEVDVEGETLARRMDAVAAMIEAEMPTRVYAVDLGGFDTHANQAGDHENLLAQLDDALGTFVGRLGDRNVTVAVYTEFGRRVAPNASGGTDHGQGGTMLLAGNVHAGHHGEPPSLSKLADGDLVTTTDYRAVLGGLLEGVLGTEAKDVFATAGKPLPLTPA